MKKIIFFGLLLASSVVSVTFAMQSNNSQSSSRKLPPCKKIAKICPDGLTPYYACARTSGVDSPDCYDTGLAINDGCNITERPCH